jgi:hypothetical protein
LPAIACTQACDGTGRVFALEEEEDWALETWAIKGTPIASADAPAIMPIVNFFIEKEEKK